ncbi:proline--tRNA ligase [Helicobacter pametensis]|uniref:proline--tRNA ligase n=1 Tax=Helicobacter pametensis TaxID=95149 RepID=UPI000484FF00|nr:proline--tRNA ligase [Helicobacter pametensis]
MRMSKSFIYTTKETPKDAELKSHQYLLRGGYIQQVGSGIYNLLPLGDRVLENIKSVIQKHMNKSGAQELTLGFVTPASFWQKSGRYEKYGKELLRFKDRKDQDFVLGPTYEEGIVECIKGVVKSYKQLPINLYQIHLKFRDEVRPRFGLIRGREFVMKDAYSFHSSTQDLDREFDLMEQTYRAIFDELGIKYAVVEADSGAIGGSGSKEFMLLAECGEDTLITCPSCGYASNIEAARRHPRQTTPLSMQPQKIHTPNLKTINELSNHLNLPSEVILKCIIKGVKTLSGNKTALFFVLGDDELEETKALNALSKRDGEVLELFDLDMQSMQDFKLGFVGLGAEADFVIFDEAIEVGKTYLSGANEQDYHQICDFQGGDQDDLVLIREGDECPNCSAKMRYQKGIEVGHIFKLGTKYSDPMGATFLDQNGKAQPFIMGCYGIGVSRILSAFIEQNHDERGIIWNEVLAPFECMVIVSNIKNQAQREEGEKIYEHLIAQGKRVLFDERDERFGVKMSDFELLGIPQAILVGKELESGKIELIDRKTLSKQSLSFEAFLGE